MAAILNLFTMPAAPRYFYARVPTASAPATTFVGPFRSPRRAKEALRRDLIESEKSAPGQRWSKYVIVRAVAEYRPRFTPNLTLQPTP